MTDVEREDDALSQLDDLWRADPGEVDTEVDRRKRRRAWRRVFIAFAIIVVLIASLVGGYVVWALTVPVGDPAMTAHAPRAPVGAAVDVPMPTEGASAMSVAGGDEYLGADASGIWVRSGGDEARPIASITKLITALVVLDAHPLTSADDPGPTLTFDEADHDLYDEYYVLGATIAAMPEGSSMSLRDAIAAMLIPSASNYADAVSTWAFGSQSGFVSAARSWLAANGLSGTTIVEPTGISARNVSTPTDLIALGKIAASDPAVAALAAMPSIALPNIGAASNTNNLLGVSGITGLKTGNLGDNTFNLLYTASLDVGLAEPLRVTGVMLGGFSRQTVGDVVVRQLDGLRAAFRDVPLAAQGDEIGTLTTAWGSSARLVLAADAAIFTWSDTPISVDLQTTTPVDYADGEKVGTVTWIAGSRTATADVVIEGDIAPPTEWWRLTHPGELGG